MKDIIKKIKYKIKGRIFDWIFGMEGKRMKQTIIVNLIKELQEQVKRFNPDNPWKVKPYVAEYLENCLNTGQAINILTQWCITKMLDIRKERQGGKLEILPEERKLFTEDIPRLLSLFKKWGLKVNFIITFNLSTWKMGRPEKSTRIEYQDIIQQLAKGLDVLFMGGEEFFGREEIAPNQKVFTNFKDLVKPGSLQFEFNLNKEWFKQFGISSSDEQILEWTKNKIAISAEEGRILCEEIFPEGFILVPIENPERYDYFDLIIKDFKDGLVPAVRRYPWRYEELY